MIKKRMFVLLFFLFGLTIFFIFCSKTTEPDQEINNRLSSSNPPSVAIAYPPNYSTIEDDTLKVKVEVSGSYKIEFVSFYVDGDSIGVDYSEPYTITLDTTLLSVDFHTVLAKAIDVEGNKSHSDVISFEFLGGTCDCEVCCEMLGVQTCATQTRTPKDECTLVDQGIDTTSVSCTAECK